MSAALAILKNDRKKSSLVSKQIYMFVYDTLIGQKMDDLSRIPVSHCPKVFVQRDYTNGTQLSFSTKFPQELVGKVTYTKQLDFLLNNNLNALHLNCVNKL